MSMLGVHFERLTTAIDWSIRQLATPRKNRIDAIRQFVGSHYHDNGTDKRVPTNFIELAITIYVRQLAARAPKAMVTAKSADLKPFAYSMELALNQIPDEIKLGSTLRRAVINAMFGWAVVKVGIEASGRRILGHDVGEPFVDLVGLDDYFVDMTAKSEDGVMYQGNEYWLPVDDARAIFGENSLQPDKHTVIGAQGEEKAEGISVGESGDVYAERIWLRDVWLPRENKLVTYAVKSKQVLRIVEWDGPEHGPYYTLGFAEVPDNLLPLPPVALWRDLHELGNSLFRKLGRQADAKKTVAAFSGGNDEDVEALKKAADGEGVRYTGQKPEAITVGGIDAPTLAFYLQVRDLFSYFAGNLDSLGGLAPTTETVGQDRLLSEAASARLRHMSDMTVDFARSIFKALAWYEWTDPIRRRTIQKTLPGTDISIRVDWSPETREGNWLDYNFDVDPYSMQDNSPSAKLAKIGMALERFVLPLLPQIEMAGGQIDFKALLDHVARFGDVPELGDIVRFADRDMGGQPVAAGANAQPTAAARPAHTTRTYERVNRPGATRHGKDDVLSRLLMGGKVQMSEAASLGRRVS